MASRQSPLEIALHTKVLLVGVGDYNDDRLTALPSPYRSVLQLETGLTDPLGCGIPANNIKKASPDAFSKQDLLQLLKAVCRDCTADDVLLIYHAGHGVIVDNEFFLCTSYTSLDNLTDTGVSATELGEILAEGNYRGSLFILDTCHAGSFAEKAPDFFRRQRGSEFKLFVSSSAAEEQAWEAADGQGTVFCQQLVKAIKGAVESDNGLLYFRDLYDYLRVSVPEELARRYQSLPEQTILYAGVLSDDPLLFVNRRLSLAQLQFKTSRITREQLRRTIRRGVAVVMGIAILAVTGLYLVLSSYQYLQVTGGKISAVQGLPHIKAFGFPRIVWEFDIPIAFLKTSSPLIHGEAVIARMDRTAAPLLPTHLTMLGKALYFNHLTEKDSVRHALRLYFQQERQNDLWLGAAMGMLAEVGHPVDTLLFKKFVLHPTEPVKLAAIRGWAKQAPDDMFKYLSRVPVPDDMSLFKEVLASPELMNSVGMKLYVKHLIAYRSTYYPAPLIANACLMTHTRLPSEDIYKMHKNRVGIDDVSARIYAVLIGDTVVNQFYLRQLAALDLPWFESAPALHNLGGRLTEDQSAILTHYLLSDTTDLANTAALKAIIRTCPSFSKKVLHRLITQNPALLERNVLIPELMLAGCISQPVKTYFINELQQQQSLNFNAVRLLDVAALRKDSSLRGWLRTNLRYYSDPMVHQAMVRTMRLLNEPFPYADFTAISNPKSVDVQIEAFRWMGAQQRILARQVALTKVGEIGYEWLPDMLPFYGPLTEAEEKMVFPLLNGTPEQSRDAARLLAACGRPVTALSLLSDWRSSIRSAALDYVVLHSDGPAILDAISKRSIYTRYQVEVIQRQLNWKKRLQTEIQRTLPQYRGWRIELLHSIYGGRMGKGVKAFLAHQAGVYKDK